MEPVISKQYIIDRTVWKPSYSIHSKGDDDKEHHKHVRVTTIGSSPDVTIFDGPTRETSILAVSHMTFGRKDFKVGLGDPSDTRSVVWEDLKHLNRIMTKYSWSMEVPVKRDEAQGHAERKSFTWKRTRSVAADGAEINTLAIRNWKLVAGEDTEHADDGEHDVDEHRVLAVFTQSRERGQCGVLQINVDHGKNFVTMVMITLLSLFERSRRAGGG